MRTVSRSVRIAVVLVLGVVTTGPAATRAAEEPQPATYVALKFEGTCDENNNRLWLTNTHTFKTVSTKVRWRAAGGKNLTEEFFPGPNSIREIGCAAEAEILEAKFADF
jgi:hypothetical protein